MIDQRRLVLPNCLPTYMKGIYILLGSNLLDRVKNLEKAEELLSVRDISILHKSSIYQSEPWGIADQPTFLNSVLSVSTHLSADLLLQSCLQVETEMGRVRVKKWGERLIDIDILYFNDQIIDSESLTVPHPGILDRRFTLLPLVEIAKNEKHPIAGLTQWALLERCSDTLNCHIYEEKSII
ncbi:MAG: 2-amino-4-hydroxy-6-hydroxymethyldihydropteridine diphosphokinase [Cyclobacteriaceae bacterium]